MRDLKNQANLVLQLLQKWLLNQPKNNSLHLRYEHFGDVLNSQGPITINYKS